MIIYDYGCCKIPPDAGGFFCPKPDSLGKMGKPMTAPSRIFPGRIDMEEICIYNESAWIVALMGLNTGMIVEIWVRK